MLTRAQSPIRLVLMKKLDTQKVKKFNRIFRKLFSMPFFLELEIPPLTTTHALLIKNYVTACSKKFQVFYMSSYPIPFTTIIFWSFRDFSWNIYIYTHTRVCVRAKSLQSYPTLCNPMDYSLPGSSIHGILQSRILEWVVMPSSRGSSQPRDQTCVSYVSCIGRQVIYH